jgi:type II secretory pathway pseudopilin PulG
MKMRMTKIAAQKIPPHASQHRSLSPANRGMTLVECLIFLTIFSIVCVAAGVGLQSISRAPGAVESRLWTSQQIATKVESLRDTAYTSLVSGSTTSQTDFNNDTYTMTWTVTEIDPAYPSASPPISKASSGLKQIVVTMNGQSLTTWVSQ